MSYPEDPELSSSMNDDKVSEIISIASYDTSPPESHELIWDPDVTPWIVAVASALEQVDPVNTIRDNDFVIERVEIFEETDTIRVHTFDTLCRKHRTVDRVDIDIYRTGFESAPTLSQVAGMICFDIETGAAIPHPEADH